MTRDELQAHSLAFQVGYKNGLVNAPVTPIPKFPPGHVYGQADISDYWWGYHTGRRERVTEQKTMLT